MYLAHKCQFCCMFQSHVLGNIESDPLVKLDPPRLGDKVSPCKVEAVW